MRFTIAALVAITLTPGVVAAQQQPPRPVLNGAVPAVSPDGKHVAFGSNRGGAYDLYVISADGSGLTQLTRSTGYESPPAWTADGEHVVFSRFANDTSRVYAVGLTGGEAGAVGIAPSARMPALSPDGTKLLYGRGAYPKMRLTVAALDGSAPRALSDTSDMVFGGVWSPDGQRIAYTRADTARRMQMWIMNADGTGARQLTNIPADEGHPQWPSWTPDGRRLAIQVGKYNPQARTENTAHIWVVDVATGKATKLAAHDRPYLDETPSWFPDGDRIAFQSDRTGKMEVWVMNADGTGARQLTH